MAETILRVAEGWLGIGALIALAFALVGVGRVDHGAKDGSWLFRLLLLPGATLLWPVVLWKWATRRREGAA